MAMTFGLAALAVFFFAVSLQAQQLKSEYVAMDAGRYDLLRAHNERVIVTFGGTLQFRRYYVVDMLHQYFTVATAIPEGIRYTMTRRGQDKILVIE